MTAPHSAMRTTFADYRAALFSAELSTMIVSVKSENAPRDRRKAVFYYLNLAALHRRSAFLLRTRGADRRANLYFAAENLRLARQMRTIQARK